MRSPVSPFSYVKPDVSMKRSQFRRPFRHLTTLSAGKLYPIMCDEVLPGDTFSVDLSALVRMSTPIHPVMDNCFIDLAFFYCPSRILWDNWKSFMGESPEDPYINPVEYSVPQLKFPEASLVKRTVRFKSVADYMGLPAGSIVESVNALPFRGFAKIWNEWYRDQNLQDAIDIDYSDSDHDYAISIIADTEWQQTCAYGGGLPPVNKFHDYFTSALLEPQKGEAVPIPLSGFAPVYANDLVDLEMINGTVDDPVRIKDSDFNDVSGLLTLQDSKLYYASGDYGYEDSIHFNNLASDLSNLVGTYATINDLRYAFQLQRFLERDAFGGTRYRELLLSHFGVVSPDATQQVPEFLGAKRIPINMSQVLQTSATNDVSPQGNTAAYSLTQDSFNGFTKSFTEHGYLYCVACIRTEHTYQQGLERMWLRKDKFDFYFPEFANISFQPIYNKQIYNPDLSVLDFDNEEANAAFEVMNEIFGYQEPWAEYRYKPNRVSGEFRSSYPQSLDVWHYADDYSEQPYLSDEWIRETRANVDRTLAVSSDLADQFIADFYFQMDTTRVMPVTSRPGLADHH